MNTAAQTGGAILRRFHTIALGAGAFACGMALRNPEKTCILERGILMASEYTAALHRPVSSEPKEPEGEYLMEILRKRGFCLANKLHLPPVADAIAELLFKRRCHVYLNTEILDVSGSSGDFCVTAWTTEGITAFHAEQIVDTMPAAWDGSGRHRISGRALCAALVRISQSTSPLPAFRPGNESVKLLTGALPEEYILRTEIPMDADASTARICLNEAWRNLKPLNPELFMGAEAVCMATEYREIKQEEIRKGMFFIPSGQYPDVVSSLEEGCRWISQH